MLSRPLAVLALILPGVAAAEATPQGAADLTALLQTYLGRTPGVVGVVADGDAYAVTLDAGPVLAMIPSGAGMTVTASPFRMRLTDNGDGTWGVVQDQALRLTASAPGRTDITVAADRAACTGVFDGALRAFVRNECEITALSVDQVTEDPILGRQVSTQYSERVVTRSTGAAGVAGGVDGTFSYTETGGRSVIEGPLAPGSAPVTLTVSYAGTRYEARTTGVRNAELLAALAWVVANPGPAATAARRDEIKRILGAGLPWFGEIDATGTIDSLNVGSPLGLFTAARVGFGGTVRGAVAEGLYKLAFNVEGLAVPPGLVPPFAEALVPGSVSLGVAASGYDAGAAAGVLLDLFDLAPGAEPSPGFDGRLLSALLPDGTVDITLTPGTVANAMYGLSFQGAMAAGPGAPPTGSGTVSATGLDAAIAALDSAPQAVKDQVLPVLGFARGLARPGPDGALVWEIDATTPGSVLVNGLDLMGLAP